MWRESKASRARALDQVGMTPPILMTNRVVFFSGRDAFGVSIGRSGSRAGVVEEAIVVSFRQKRSGTSERILFESRGIGSHFGRLGHRPISRGLGFREPPDLNCLKMRELR